MPLQIIQVANNAQRLALVPSFTEMIHQKDNDTFWIGDSATPGGFQADGSGGGAASLGDLIDVTLPPLPDINDVLQFNGSVWVNAPVAVSGDDLGNHTATQALDMGGFAITNVGNVDGVDVGAHVGDATLHRAIDDGASGATDLWSASKISTELSGKAGTSHTHVLADVTDSGALAALSSVGTAQIDDEAVSLAKMAHMATGSLLGRSTAATGDVEVLSASSVRSLLNVEDGATADQSAAEVPFTPTGGLSATDVQAALAELDTEKAGTSVFSQDTAGLAPGPSASDISSNHILRADGTWVAGGGGGDNLGDHTATEDLDMGGFSITNVLTVDGVNVESHAGRHVRTGTDVIDADILEVSYVPDHYTRTIAPSEVTDLTELTSHLAGIDDELDKRAPAENGFVDVADSTISFVDGTRTFTIAPAVTSFDYYHASTRYTKSSSEDIVISDVEGLHYIYYDGTTLSETTTFTPDIISLYAFVCAIYWDATNNESILVMEERHGAVMDSQTHSYHHNTVGSLYDSGLALGNMDVDGSGDDNSAAQFSVSDGVIWDEDIRHTITDGSPQELSTIAEIPILYRSGASGDWRKIAATQYPITTTGSGRAAWNEDTGATWQLTEVSNNDFVLMHYFATGDVNHPIIGIVGQAEYSTANAARTGADTEIMDLQTGDMATLTPEFVAIATVIFQTGNGYSNPVQSRVRSTDEGADYIDWREQRGSSSGVAPTVFSVFGRVGSVVAASSDYDASQVDNDSGVSGAFVSDALDTLDAGKAATSHTHTLSDVTDSGALAALATVGTSEIDDEAVTLAKMAHMGTASLLGRSTAGTGDVEVLSAASARALLNVEDGAEANDVDTVFGRSGAVVAAASDYDASQIDNDSNVAGAFVDDALNTLADALEIRVGTWRSGASGQTVTSTLTAHDLNVEINNTDGTNHFTWTTGDDEVVVKKAGWYTIWTRVIFDGEATQWDNMRGIIEVNGTAQIGGDTRQEIRLNGDSVTIFAQWDVELSADDTVGVQVGRTLGSGTDPTTRGSGGCVLGIRRIPGL